jgi:hypothetical protein
MLTEINEESLWVNIKMVKLVLKPHQFNQAQHPNFLLPNPHDVSNTIVNFRGRVICDQVKKNFLTVKFYMPKWIKKK